MAVILALPQLFDAVNLRFTTEMGGSAPPQSFGWREPAKRTGKLRIVWVPGDGDEVGELRGASDPGRDPRPLATLDELFTVYLEAGDATAPETERAQYIAARLLFDAWYRAVYLAARGRFGIKSVTWVDGKNERRYGATIRVVGTIEAMVPDAATGETLAGTRADISTSELSVTEHTLSGMTARIATTAAIVLTGLQVIDGVQLVDGDRVLVKDQMDGSFNGVYAAAAGAWARTTDADTSGEVPSGLLVFVGAGAVNGNAEFILTTPGPIVLGTTLLTFARVQT